MTTLYYIPIEPLAERYTEQWYRRFPEEFREAGFDVATIDGEPLSHHVDVGSWLPMNSTVHYKAAQMQTVSALFQDKQIKDGDIFFVADLEFWGIEAIRVMAQINQVNVKIYSFLHAASYTIEDAMAVTAPYQKYTELGWAMMCDGIFVGSHYHKKAFIERRVMPYASKEDAQKIANKIHVVGNPVFLDEYRLIGTPEKKRQVIISNRFDWEKRPNLSLDFAYLLKKEDPSINIIVTTSRPEFKSNKKWLMDKALGMQDDGIITIYSGLSKREYHQHLAESKVMLTNSIEENFGYCIAEALVYNTYPLAPNKLSHPELCWNDPRLLFDDEDEVVAKALFLLNSFFTVSHYVEPYTEAIKNMAEIIKQG